MVVLYALLCSFKHLPMLLEAFKLQYSLMQGTLLAVWNSSQICY
ncbi:hypothetical protein F383_11692 [Gossypium arboreum]|uniref:Uncharacterized protein n=2 Tax=Gossypium arboreum TaxID=29729 RepID=A0A0B0N9R5_GOSAR|nr:hypothetical protein F383_11692 [Gossypium arboreum]